MKKLTFIICAFLLFMMACTSRNNANMLADRDSIAIVDEHLDTLRQPSPDEFDDGHMPPPPPEGKGFDGPPPPPPHGKGHHKPDNMRGFDPASEDDMDDNGMSRYMENNDDEGWD